MRTRERERPAWRGGCHFLKADSLLLSSLSIKLVCVWPGRPQRAENYRFLRVPPGRFSAPTPPVFPSRFASHTLPVPPRAQPSSLKGSNRSPAKANSVSAKIDSSRDPDYSTPCQWGPSQLSSSSSGTTVRLLGDRPSASESLCMFRTRRADSELLGAGYHRRTG